MRGDKTTGEFLPGCLILYSLILVNDFLLAVEPEYFDPAAESLVEEFLKFCKQFCLGKMLCKKRLCCKQKILQTIFYNCFKIGFTLQPCQNQAASVKLVRKPQFFPVSNEAANEKAKKNRRQQKNECNR